MENLLFIGLADVEIKIDFSIILRGNQMWADSERVTEQQSLSPHSMGKDTTKINVFQGLIWRFYLLFVYLTNKWSEQIRRSEVK